MFWNRNKKSESVVWRDAKGKIVCPGDNCPMECDARCPIWLNTKGLELLMMDMPSPATTLFQQAVALAPDFPDAVNNLGSAYGMSGQHQKAYEEFKKAVELKPYYPQALSGLIVSAKNLGKYEEALNYCDAYDRLPGYSADALRNEINIILSGEQQFDDDEPVDWMELTVRLLDKGRECGYIHSAQFAHIPELLLLAEPVCQKLSTALMEYEEAHPEHCLGVLGILLWSAFAGMGAVYHWNENWPSLSKKGVFETLTEKRGLFAMDEYVLDTIGIPFDSAQCKEFSVFLQELAAECNDNIASNNGDIDSNNLLSGAKAMYAFGMVFEMNRLGMR